MLLLVCFSRGRGSHVLLLPWSVSQHGSSSLHVQVVKELQTSAHEAIVLLRAMIGEVCLNVEEEETEICSLFNSLQVSQVCVLEKEDGFLQLLHHRNSRRHVKSIEKRL